MKPFLLLVLAAFMQAARSFTEAGSPAGNGTALAAGYLALSALLAGRLFRDLRLPRLTGYLAVGMVVGPQGLALLTQPMVQSLALVNGVAIGLIALTAGIEIQLQALRPLLRVLAWIAGLAVLGTALLLGACLLILRPLLPFLRDMPVGAAAAIALVLGVVMVAQSPAVVVALRDETRADGPVMRTVLAVVVLADLLVIILFALASAGAKAVFGAEGALIAALGTLFWKVFGSAAAGAVIGASITAYVEKVRAGAPLFILTTSVIVAEVGGRLELDPLLTLLVAGLLVRNLGGGRAHVRVGEAIAASSLPVYALFFAVAGAGIHLGDIPALALPLLALWLTRAGGLYGGTWLAARAAGAPAVVGRYAGLGLIPQAGLALALVVLFRNLFPELAQAASLALALLALDELVGPVLFRWALVRSGEVTETAAREGTPASAPPPAEAR